MSYNKYMQEMTTNAWGDHLTLDVIANIFNVRIWCIKSAHHFECSLVAPQQILSTTGDIYVGHLGERNYVSVVPNQVYVDKITSPLTQKLNQEFIVSGTVL